MTENRKGEPSIPILRMSEATETLVPKLQAVCEDFGFFLIADHGISEELIERLEHLAQEFFALSEEEKMKIAMSEGGIAWRGFFPVGGELTSGKPDLKEGIYFGEELESDDSRVQRGLPLHGKNLFPELPGFRETVLEYQNLVTVLGHRLMALLSLSLGLPENYFYSHYTRDPTLLFRIFHYPPMSSEHHESAPWGVGEHTDYGILTILRQDDVGGLEVKASGSGEWIPIPPVPETFVCNIGDMLDYLTKGRYRSAPHRVRNLSGRERYSLPFFFDPNFDAKIVPLPPEETSPSISISSAPAHSRWDGTDLHAFRGTYGEYLLGKVGKVFPELKTRVIPGSRE